VTVLFWAPLCKQGQNALNIIEVRIAAQHGVPSKSAEMGWHTPIHLTELTYECHLPQI